MSGPCEGFTAGNVIVLGVCFYLIRRRLTQPQSTPSRGGLFAKALAKKAAKKGMFELFSFFLRRR